MVNAATRKARQEAKVRKQAQAVKQAIVVAKPAPDNSCANSYCRRRVRVNAQNRYGVCHACFGVVNVVRFMFEQGILGAKSTKKAASALLWTPGQE